ncbi:hypothetical protein C7447_102263 [Tenacibaculum adriaticum]|uniref:DUF1566 domain-containing protein n=1 Tax=Tenacibaculum adriaticum TaxID=413713 RepID=A0A5S5DT42_9FLAO|nr:hypothetical protein [Tenacibaculum adriaticum]TYP98945.1 hypothetical protein C7447_102263 [Tenacibaculum adriaticum]
MKKVLFILVALLMFNCTKEDETELTVFNPELSVLQNLENGVAVLEIKELLGAQALFGIEYGGGFIFYVDETDGTLLVATDYTAIGATSWGDHFDLTNSALIGAGLENTQQIVDGNLNDNSSVTNGFEFGSNDYVFKIVLDLEYKNYNDWFVPSSGAMKAIFDNVHSQGLGNFDETIFYWTSTKEGYQPYVMSFNSNFGGETFLGSCFDSNGVLIVRKF